MNAIVTHASIVRVEEAGGEGSGTLCHHVAHGMARKKGVHDGHAVDARHGELREQAVGSVGAKG